MCWLLCLILYTVIPCEDSLLAASAQYLGDDLTPLRLATDPWVAPVLVPVSPSAGPLLLPAPTRAPPKRRASRIATPPSLNFFPAQRPPTTSPPGRRHRTDTAQTAYKCLTRTPLKARHPSPALTPAPADADVSPLAPPSVRPLHPRPHPIRDTQPTPKDGTARRFLLEKSTTPGQPCPPHPLPARC